MVTRSAADKMLFKDGRRGWGSRDICDRTIRPTNLQLHCIRLSEVGHLAWRG